MELQKEVVKKQLKFSENEHILKMNNNKQDHKLKAQLLQLEIEYIKVNN